MNSLVSATASQRGIPAWLNVVLVALFISFTAVQASEIKGLVSDASTDEPLIGANVYIQGTIAGGATDSDGYFSFEYDFEGEVTLVASYVGYKLYSQTVSSSDDLTRLSLKLAKDVFQSEEVVVTGIANKRSKAVAEVAVSRVSASELTDKTNYSSLNQLLNGKVAGVQVRSSSGNIGSGYRFIVRSGGGLNGQGQPVVYIDGIRVENAQMQGEGTFSAGGQRMSTLADLNPDDIESVEVLKGPAAASTYGTNGSNGVVLITTKKGRVSSDPRGSMDVNYKFTSGTNSQSFEYSEEDFVSANDANNIFITGTLRQHNLNISGGNNFIKYYTSFEDRFEEGHILNTWQDRQNFRANIDVIPHEKLNFSVNAGFSQSDAERPQNDNNTLGWLGNTLLFANSYRFTDSTSIANFDDAWETNRFLGGFQASYRPIAGLEARASLGIDNSGTRQDETRPSNLPFSGVVNGERVIWNRDNNQVTADFNVNYNYSLGSRIKATSIVGTQLFDQTLTTNNFSAQNFDTELITEIGAGVDLIAKGETKIHSKTAGIFTDHSLSFDETYFATLGIRNDFASSVGLDAPSIFYPHVSFAARLDQMGIMPGIFNLFKLRAAYGEAGILPEPTDAILRLWEAESGGHGGGAVLSSIGNIEIQPEKVKEFEIGFDTEIFSNYSLEFTYYLQSAEESIIDFNNAPSSGETASPVPFNIGKIEGSGFETLLQGAPVRTRNFQIGFNLVNAYQTNEVVDLGGAQPIFDGFDVNVTKEGLPNHEFYIEDVVGALFDTDGSYLGPELTEDRVALGNPVPDYNGSFSLNITLMRNLNIYGLVDWATGHKVYNNTRRFSVRFGNDPLVNRLRYQLGLSSTPPEGEENLAQFVVGSSEYNAAAVELANNDGNVQSNFIEDGDFFKFREISVNYSLRDLLKNFNYNRYVRDIVIGVSGRNLWTATKYSGADPEVNWRGARSLSRGQDFLTLQNPRSFNVYVQLGF